MRAVMCTAVCICSAMLLGQAPANPADLTRAEGEMRAGHPQEAAAVLTLYLSEHPKDERALYDLGSARLKMGQYDAAIASLQSGKAVSPHPWREDALLLKTYTLADHKQERDKLRSELRDLAKKGTEPELTKTGGIEVDDFKVAGDRVVAVEHPKLEGKYNFRYNFYVLDGRGEVKRMIALESDDVDQMLYKKKSKDKDDESDRKFSLDGYQEGAHSTFGFLDGEPGYDEVKRRVVAILSAEEHPTSTSTAGSK